MLRNNYEILDHPADLKVRAFGKSLSEVFLNMILAIFDHQKAEIKSRSSKIKRKIRINSNNLKSLLVDFLSEILYLSQVYKETYSNINFTKLTETELAGELIGQRVESFGEEIKAVTYYDLEIKKIDDHYQATITFDI